MLCCRAGLEGAVCGFFSGRCRWDGLLAENSCGLLLRVRCRVVGLVRYVDWRIRAWSSLQLLNGGVVVLEVAILEEDQVMVSVRLDAILAEGVGALVASALDLLALMPRLLAVGDAFTGRGLHWSRGSLAACVVLLIGTSTIAACLLRLGRACGRMVVSWLHCLFAFATCFIRSGLCRLIRHIRL